MKASFLYISYDVPKKKNLSAFYRGFFWLKTLFAINISIDVNHNRKMYSSILGIKKYIITLKTTFVCYGLREKYNIAKRFATYRITQSVKQKLAY